MRKGFSSLLLLLALSSSHAQEDSVSEPKRKGTGLEEFFKLNEQLPQAVCDESLVSRPPTLSTQKGEPDLASYMLNLELPEEKLVSFLMEDSETVLGHPSFWGDQKGSNLLATRKKISLAICTALVEPGGLKKLFEEKPAYFLGIKTTGKKRSLAQGKGTVFFLRDVEGRFGKLDEKTWVAGWIEPHEIEKAVHGRRVYRRLSHPITNRTQFIQISTQDGIPLGYFFPTSKTEDLSWERLEVLAKSEDRKKKKIETYRLMVELGAYQALRAKPKASERIRKLQEFYKSLLGAYQVFPDDERFKAYGKKSKKLSKKTVQKILDKKFFKALEAARMNGAHVSFAYFEPDSRLHAIYEEYASRLSSL